MVVRIAGMVAFWPIVSVFRLSEPATQSRAAVRRLEVNSLSQKQALLLLSIARTLFPHDFLSDEQYMKVVASLDAKAAVDKEVASTLTMALRQFPDNFAALPEVERDGLLRTLETSPFFRLVYDETIVGLYGDSTVSSLLGYEGSSLEHGGYVERGFDDISWLPKDEPALK
jgi:hypothetical protein